MGFLGWLAVILLIFYGVGFFLKLGVVALNIILILAIVSLIGNFLFKRTPTK